MFHRVFALQMNLDMSIEVRLQLKALCTCAALMRPLIPVKCRVCFQTALAEKTLPARGADERPIPNFVVYNVMLAKRVLVEECLVTEVTLV